MISDFLTELLAGVLTSKIVEKVVKPNFVVVKLFSDKVELLNIKNGIKSEFYSDEKYSSDRLLIADNLCAEKFLKHALSQFLNQEKKMFKKYLKIVFQVGDIRFVDISQIESMIYRDVLEHVGAKEVCFLRGIGVYQVSEILEKFEAGELTF